MATKKVSTSKKTKKTPASAKAKPAKVPFYAQPARLFSAVADGKLPRGVYAKTTLDVVRIGNAKVCVYEGKLSEMLTALFKSKGIKLNESGDPIPSPASPSATPSA